LQPFKEAFLVDGSKAIHVPGENTNCGHFIQSSISFGEWNRISLNVGNPGSRQAFIEHRG
jgi:hypothetical protein